MAGIYPLKGTVKHYDWGGYTFIPYLLDTDNKENKPFAEYWLGTHPLGMGQVETGGDGSTPLNALTGNLPYLFKAQDVKEMLSIQVHPSKEAAEKEFARENAASGQKVFARETSSQAEIPFEERGALVQSQGFASLHWPLTPSPLRSPGRRSPDHR